MTKVVVIITVAAARVVTSPESWYSSPSSKQQVQHTKGEGVWSRNLKMIHLGAAHLCTHLRSASDVSWYMSVLPTANHPDAARVTTASVPALVLLV